ncbi:ABC transporter ATP-binding protein [Lysinibacter cavernae]|uniref:ABC-type nitrate/sulfonate/bicarbonate transport system ATPase subunit n=1 Tax=Lysinibacter cavernae TaxID=1640652 RepID=A0A7X5R044_9MICO|nr:ABC transporter ATP-binding protein [Lysinibacter cavernae]NIH53067.1 ABC-type nitrate/sulfonate/bicarbonate transport system ATPase subunit [Lysinibacter cavernae]
MTNAPAISIQHLNKSFGRVPVISDLSLDVASGEFVSLIGPSGCGKSTLFNILAGLDSADAGTVFLHGESINSPREAAEHCAYMPQDDVLFAWRNVLDNAIIGLQIQGVSKAEARAKALELLPVFGLSGTENERPEHLSGGMRQRVSLLRTVLLGKRILLLDEPFAALDSLTRTDMQEWLGTLWSQLGLTIVLITHDIREAVRLSDRVIALAPRPTAVKREVALDAPHAGIRTRSRHPTVLDAEAALTDLLHGV